MMETNSEKINSSECIITGGMVQYLGVCGRWRYRYTVNNRTCIAARTEER